MYCDTAMMYTGNLYFWIYVGDIEIIFFEIMDISNDADVVYIVECEYLPITSSNYY